MPRVCEYTGHRVYFYSNEGVEPPHVHVRQASSDAKFWLEPVGRERSKAFSEPQLNWIRKQLEARSTKILKVWYEHFSP